MLTGGSEVSDSQTYTAYKQFTSSFGCRGYIAIIQQVTVRKPLYINRDINFVLKDKSCIFGVRDDNYWGRSACCFFANNRSCACYIVDKWTNNLSLSKNQSARPKLTRFCKS